MKLYKPSYRDKKTGKKKKCKHWYLTFTDNKQIRRRLPCFTSKRATEIFALKLDELLQACGIINRDLQKWLDDMPVDMKNRLVGYGLVGDSQTTKHLNKTLVEHLKAYCESMAADNLKERHIKQVQTVISWILRGCGFKTWPDVDGNMVKDFLAKGRGPSGYGQRTYNSYLQNFKGFCAWLVREGRVVGSNPMAGAKPIKQTEYRHPRRSLTVDEAARLIKTTEVSQKRWRLSGHARALVYSLALQTGLRAGEIRSLLVRSFDFNASPRTVRVEASDSKGKRADTLILMDSTAKAIEDLLTGKEPGDVAFTMPNRAATARMIRDDLREARIDYCDDAGRYCDFHSLRHSYISHLALAGVHPTVCQKLARHSKIETTMKYYTHVLHDSEVNAIKALRDLTATCQTGGQKPTPVDGGGQKDFDNGSKRALSA